MLENTENRPKSTSVPHGPAVACWIWNFDAVSIILLRDQTTRLGELVTAAVIAGGSKASIGLFRELMRIRSDAEKERRELKDQDRPAGAAQ